jgi:hypothetical protein
MLLFIHIPLCESAAKAQTSYLRVRVWNAPPKKQDGCKMMTPVTSSNVPTIDRKGSPPGGGTPRNGIRCSTFEVLLCARFPKSQIQIHGPRSESPPEDPLLDLICLGKEKRSGNQRTRLRCDTLRHFAVGISRNATRLLEEVLPGESGPSCLTYAGVTWLGLRVLQLLSK